MPLVAGTVHCVRLTDTQARLSAFGQSFTLDPKYRRSYIRASLSVAEQRLRFYFQETAKADAQLVATRSFQLPGEVHPYTPTLASNWPL